MDAETHNIPPGLNTIRRVSSGGALTGGWEAEACTPPGVLLRYFWGWLCSISRVICMIFVADLIACGISSFMSAVACKPVTLRLWSGLNLDPVNDACRF